jgi:hypothetical protein
VGLGSDSGSVAETVKKLALRQTYSGPPAASDPLTPQTQDEQMRAAQKMREGLNSAFGIKNRYGQIAMRGTEDPNLETPKTPTASTPGSTPTPTRVGPDGDPIIPIAASNSQTDENGNPVTTQEARDKARLDELRRRGKIRDDGGII